MNKSDISKYGVGRYLSQMSDESFEKLEKKVDEPKLEENMTFLILAALDFAEIESGKKGVTEQELTDYVNILATMVGLEAARRKGLMEYEGRGEWLTKEDDGSWIVTDKGKEYAESLKK